MNDLDSTVPQAVFRFDDPAVHLPPLTLMRLVSPDLRPVAVSLPWRLAA